LAADGESTWRFGAEVSKPMTFRKISITMLAAASLWACGGKAKGTHQSGGGDTGASLYDRLGRRDAITAVVKDFVEQRVAKDDRIQAYFAHTDIPGFEDKLVDQICEASGGPCKYTGKDMKATHAGMNLKEADFGALVEDLKASLDQFHVGAKEQSDLLGALARMHDDIVTAK
jgi:hemoglobin